MMEGRERKRERGRRKEGEEDVKAEKRWIEVKWP